jgi:hypothetical protein
MTYIALIVKTAFGLYNVASKHNILVHKQIRERKQRLYNLYRKKHALCLMELDVGRGIGEEAAQQLARTRHAGQLTRLPGQELGQRVPGAVRRLARKFSYSFAKFSLAIFGG